MARIVFGSYMIRYPLGGMLSWALQYLVGFQRLGHDVYLVEKAHYPNACFDPLTNEMTDECSSGTTIVNQLLESFDLQDRWCFVDYNQRWHGLSRLKILEIFRNADVFIDGGTHGAWLEEAQSSAMRVLIDGEPGFTQIKWESRLKRGEMVPEYDRYYSNGCLIGKASCTAPLAGRDWNPLWNPVLPELFERTEAAGAGASYTTVMNWQSHDSITYGGQTYGQKDVEFAKFVDLPTRVTPSMEVAVAGQNVPRVSLRQYGWSVQDAHAVTRTFDAYREYIRRSRGEFSVCKNVFVETHCGWFSDRSAAYLATGRPVVLQDTGFGAHLPTGEGLFAVNDVQEAANAIAIIESDYSRHSKRAREIVLDCLSARVVLGGFLEDLGL